MLFAYTKISATENEEVIPRPIALPPELVFAAQRNASGTTKELQQTPTRHFGGDPREILHAASARKAEAYGGERSRFEALTVWLGVALMFSPVRPDRRQNAFPSFERK